MASRDSFHLTCKSIVSSFVGFFLRWVWGFQSQAYVACSFRKDARGLWVGKGVSGGWGRYCVMESEEALNGGD